MLIVFFYRDVCFDCFTYSALQSNLHQTSHVDRHQSNEELIEFAESHGVKGQGHAPTNMEMLSPR